MEEQLLGLWVSILSLTTASESNVTAPYLGRAVLPCSRKDSNTTTTIRVYWQKETDSQLYVVNAHCKPPTKACGADSNYRNRSNFTGPMAQGNFSITLLNIRLQDEGSYDCILTDKGGHVDTHATVHLNVVARYSQPVVTGPSPKNPHSGENVSLTCTTTGGYPKRHVQWLNKTSESFFSEHLVKTEHNGMMGSGGKYQLFNVTSTLRVKASHDHIVCQIVNNQTEEIRMSDPVQMLGASDGSLGSQKTAGATSAITAFAVWCIVLTNLHL